MAVKWTWNQQVGSDASLQILLILNQLFSFMAIMANLHYCKSWHSLLTHGTWSTCTWPTDTCGAFVKAVSEPAMPIRSKLDKNAVKLACSISRMTSLVTSVFRGKTKQFSTWTLNLVTNLVRINLSLGQVYFKFAHEGHALEKVEWDAQHRGFGIKP